MLCCVAMPGGLGCPSRPESLAEAARGAFDGPKSTEGTARGVRGTDLGPFWADSGSIWKRAECLERRQGRVAEHFSQILLFSLLKPTWGRFCLSRGPSGGNFGALWVLFGQLWSLLGRPCGLPRTPFGPLGAPERLSKASERLSGASERLSRASERLSRAPERLFKAPERLSKASIC